MKFLSFSLLLSCAALSFAQTPRIAYQADPEPAKLPDGMYFGEVAGVALNSHGNIFVFNRGAQTELLEFNPDGSFLRTLGKNLYGFSFAHVVRIDKYDNIWCVDEGANMVIKFSPAGRVLMVLGRKPESVESPGAGEPQRPARPEWFNRPTDVAWDSEDNIYISDGYGNSRVAKFDKNGKFLKAWGERGSAPGQFNLPHTIAIDRENKVYVGDRSNNRIQVFDHDGNFLTQWTNIGAPWAICITNGPKQFIYSSDSNGTGQIYKLDLQGNILGTFGSRGKLPGEFGWVHEMSCSREDTIYVAELLNWRVQKLTIGSAK
jgi:DNA-binding beta-propeller fold protein YncE